MDPVVIVGGGPAGSALGSYLSMAGIENIILEKAIHPRPHVGESLVSSTTRVFQDIGFVETMDREGFVRKYGAAWHPPKGKGTVAIEFREFPQEGINQDYSYHVDRAKMDLLLLKHAEKLGSKIHQGVAVKRVLFDENQRATGVQLDLAGQSVTVPASVVVDATGRSTLLGRQLRRCRGDACCNGNHRQNHIHRNRCGKKSLLRFRAQLGQLVQRPDHAGARFPPRHAKRQTH